MSRCIDVTCDIDIEQSFDSFHAHAIPDGIGINPGDVVILHNAPDKIAFGDSYTGTCEATVIRAGWARRLWTQFAGVFALAELYEVGFQPIDVKG